MFVHMHWLKKVLLQGQNDFNSIFTLNSLTDVSEANSVDPELGTSRCNGQKNPLATPKMIHTMIIVSKYLKY